MNNGKFIYFMNGFSFNDLLIKKSTMLGVRHFHGWRSRVAGETVRNDVALLHIKVDY